MNESPNMHNRLVVAANAGSEYSSNTITVTANNHYITQPFPLGNVIISSSNTTLVSTSGSLGADVLTLATKTGTSTPNLVVLDANGRLPDGTLSYGRRVLLPWGGSGFDVRLLNKDGLMVMRRSLDWAAQPIVPRSPVGHWPLNEVGGNVAYDVSATNHGTYQGSYWLGDPSPMGNGATFDGQGSFVLIPNAATLNLRNAITITAWVKCDTWANGNHRVIQKGNADNQFRLTCESSLMKWDLKNVGTLTAALPTEDVWVHVAACYDGARMTIYYDGVQVAQQNATGQVATTNDPLHIATKKVGAPMSDSYLGMLADVQLFDYGLGASEVYHIYKQGTVDDQNPTPKLVALYEFKETVEQPVLMHHWKLDESGGVAVGNQLTVNSQSIIVSYDSSKGAAGAGNIGSSAVVSTNSTSAGKIKFDGYGNLSGDAYCGSGGTASSVITTASQGLKGVMTTNVVTTAPATPSSMPATLNNQTISANTTINADKRYNNLTINGTSIVTISGNVRILCDGNLTMQDTSQFVVPVGSSLNIYVSGAISMSGSAALNADTAAVTRVKLHHIATSTSNNMTLGDDAVVAAVVYTARDLTLNDRSRVYGRLCIAGSMTMNGDSATYVDIAQPSLGPAFSPAADNAGGFNGTYRGGITGGQSGHGGDGLAAQFNGSSAFVLLQHSNTMLLNDGAASFWFNSTNLTGKHGLLSKDCSSYATGGGLNVYTNGTALYATLKNTTTTYTINTTTALATNTWYNAVVTWGPGGFKLYVNGVLVGSNVYVGGLGSSSGGTGNREQLIIGADKSGSATLTYSTLASYFAGKIDDVRVYSRSLDAAQVLKLYQKVAIGTKAGPGMVVLDTGASAGEPLNLYIPDSSKVAWQAGGGLKFTSSTKVASPVTAPKLKTLLTPNNQMTMHVVFIPTDISQTGPAMMVTHSATSAASNFSFGQSAGSYAAKIRTSATGADGGSYLTSPASLTANTMQQVIVVFDGATMKVHRNGAQEASVARTGNFSTWTNTYRMTMGNEETGSQPWLGTLQKVAIYDRAFNASQLANVFADQPPGDGTGQQRLAVQWDEQP